MNVRFSVREGSDPFFGGRPNNNDEAMKIYPIFGAPGVLHLPTASFQPRALRLCDTCCVLESHQKYHSKCARCKEVRYCSRKCQVSGREGGGVMGRRRGDG